MNRENQYRSYLRTIIVNKYHCNPCNMNYFVTNNVTPKYCWKCQRVLVSILFQRMRKSEISDFIREKIHPFHFFAFHLKNVAYVRINLRPGQSNYDKYSNMWFFLTGFPRWMGNWKFGSNEYHILMHEEDSLQSNNFNDSLTQSFVSLKIIQWIKHVIEKEISLFIFFFISNSKKFHQRSKEKIKMKFWCIDCVVFGSKILPK